MLLNCCQMKQLLAVKLKLYYQLVIPYIDTLLHLLNYRHIGVMFITTVSCFHVVKTFYQQHLHLLLVCCVIHLVSYVFIIIILHFLDIESFAADLEIHETDSIVENSSQLILLHENLRQSEHREATLTSGNESVTMTTPDISTDGIQYVAYSGQSQEETLEATPTIISRSRKRGMAKDDTNSVKRTCL